MTNVIKLEREKIFANHQELAINIQIQCYRLIDFWFFRAYYLPQYPLKIIQENMTHNKA